MNFQGITLCCPACRADLRSEGPLLLVCAACERQYPVLAGIPDLRVFPDPYIGLEADREKGLKLAKAAEGLTLAELVAHYYASTSVVPAADARRYSAGVLAARGRAEAVFEEWEAPAGDSGAGKPGPLLDLGCGTGPMLVGAARSYQPVVGVDIAFRWLVVATKRLEEAGVQATLICACAEALPFPDRSIDRVVSESTLEHARNQEAALREVARVLRRGGRVSLSTPNRWSIGPDPQTGLWAGSWMPDRLVGALVERQGGIPPRRRLLSAGGVERLMRRAGFTERAVALADVPRAQQALLGSGPGWAVAAFHRAKRLPVAGSMLRALGPMLHASGRVPVVHPRDGGSGEAP